MPSFAHGVMFHHFHDDHYHPRAQGAISAGELRAILLGLGVERFLTPADWTSRALAATLEPQHLCITLDDALLCQHDIALPVFDELGLKAFWFVYSSVFEGHLERLELYRHFRTVHFESLDDFYTAFSRAARERNAAAYEAARRAFEPAEYLKPFPFYTEADRWFRYLRDELLGPDDYNGIMDRMMAEGGMAPSSLRDRLWMNDSHLSALVRDGHAVGLHSTTHPTRLERLSPAAQREEYGHNRLHLERATGVAPFSMSHPCNSYSADTLALLRDMGIRIGFRSNMDRQPAHGLLEFPREDHANLMHLVTAET